MTDLEKHYFEYLDFLEKEIITILVHNKMFREVTEIIRNNPTIYQGNSFYSWMVSAYVSDITVRIRRLVDEDKKVKSLVNFLKELKDDSTIRTRAHHVNFYKENFILEEIGNRTFDNLAGIGAGEFSADIVQKDIDDLKDECKKIVVFTHNFIAHTSANVTDKDGNPKISMPTFADLDKAFIHLDQLIMKYFLLLKTVDKGKSVMPSWGYNWKSIFEVPWINS